MDIFSYLNLKDRDLLKEGLFVAEGRFLTERVLSSSWDLLFVACLSSLEGEFRQKAAKRGQGLPDCPVFGVSREVLESVAGYTFHRGVLAVGRRTREMGMEKLPEWLSCGRRIVMASSLGDPFNVGGLIRSAAAFGWDGVVILDDGADPFSRGALRASMGAAFTLPLWMPSHEEVTSLIREAGYTVIGTVVPPLEGLSLPEYIGPEKIALMFGNEGAGLPKNRRDECDVLLTIPMPGRVDSLNVGVAAGIFLYVLGQDQLQQPPAGLP
jgi:tRNA G18 (ribose-2'-O)-methylase SpoU